MYVVRRECFPLTKKVDKENIYMRNSSTSKVLSVGHVILKMIFGKLLTLNNLLHIAGIRKINFNAWLIVMQK
jgi:hypothetical protein